MAVYIWEDGIVDSSEGGPVTLVTDPCQTTRRVLFVDESHANASDTNAGTERHAPLATLAAAYTAAAAGEIIWIGPNHTEQVTLTIAKIGLSIIGGGTGTSRPYLQPALANGKVFTVTADAVELDNLQIIELTDGSPAELIAVNGDYCRLRRLYIPLNNYTDAVIVGAGGSATFCQCRELEITNVSTAVKTGTTYTPTHGISLASATDCVGFEARGCTFDGGIDAFRLGAIHCTVALTGYTIWENTLSNGATIQFTHASARGMYSNNTLSPSSRIVTASSTYEFPNGLVDQDEDGGHDFLAGPNVILTALPIWVDSATGSNSNAGTNRKKPLASILTAIGNFTGAGGGVIVCERNHSETWDYATETTRVVTKNDFKLFGLGTTSDRPTLRATSTDLVGHPTVGPVLRLEGTNSAIHGFQFPASTVAPTTYRISLVAAGPVLEGCAFTCGALDSASVLVADEGYTVESNTATVTASGPIAWVDVASANASFNLLENNSVDGGSVGFTSAGILLGTQHSTVCRTNTLLGGAQIIAPKGVAFVAVVDTIAESSLAVEWV